MWGGEQSLLHSKMVLRTSHVDLLSEWASLILELPLLGAHIYHEAPQTLQMHLRAQAFSLFGIHITEGKQIAGYFHLHLQIQYDFGVTSFPPSLCSLFFTSLLLCFVFSFIYLLTQALRGSFMQGAVWLWCNKKYIYFSLPPWFLAQGP